MTEISIVDRVKRLSDQAIQLCYHCHECRAGCPVARAMDYGPDGILRLLSSPSRPMEAAERALCSRDIWLCLGCEMCGTHCPNGIDVGKVMIALRQIAAEHGYRREDCERLRQALLVREMEGGDQLCAGVQRLNQLSERISATHNVSGDDNSGRTIWSQNLAHIPEGLEGRQGAEIVYIVGCVGAFFPRSYRVPQSMTRILEAVQADFTTLGGQEWCCGYPLLAMGETEQARHLARHNLARVKDLGASRIVSTCPSCYHMWRFIYPELMGEEIHIEVLHATQLLAEWIATERLSLEALPLRVTYHDPCDLGRKSGVYDAPRQVLGAAAPSRRSPGIPGLTFVEMSSSGQISECCGGGGNLETFDPDVVSEVALRRIDRACEVEAQVLVSACQQCERTLMNAVRHHPAARRARMRVMDVTELVCQAMDQAIHSDGEPSQEKR
jgi:heterodisulfide reductase subunit D